MPNQCYDVPSRKVGRRFVEILSVDIGGVHARKCNYDRLVMFHSVILQRTQGVNIFKHICAPILFLLDLWNHREFE